MRKQIPLARFPFRTYAFLLVKFRAKFGLDGCLWVLLGLFQIFSSLRGHFGLRAPGISLIGVATGLALALVPLFRSCSSPGSSTWPLSVSEPSSASRTTSPGTTSPASTNSFPGLKTTRWPSGTRTPNQSRGAATSQQGPTSGNSFLKPCTSSPPPPPSTLRRPDRFPTPSIPRQPGAPGP